MRGTVITEVAGAATRTTIDIVDEGVIYSAAGALVVLLIASMWLATLVICRSVKANSREAVAAYDLGEQIGRDRGYEEGRRVARPVVVPLVQPCTCTKEAADVRQTVGVG